MSELSVSPHPPEKHNKTHPRRGVSRTEQTLSRVNYGGWEQLGQRCDGHCDSESGGQIRGENPKTEFVEYSYRQKTFQGHPEHAGNADQFPELGFLDTALQPRDGSPGIVPNQADGVGKLQLGHLPFDPCAGDEFADALRRGEGWTWPNGRHGMMGITRLREVSSVLPLQRSE